MLHALVWFVVLSLAALWSLTAWGVHALGAWTLTNAGALGGAAAQAAGAVDAWLPAWLEPWLPPETGALLAAMAQGLQPLTDFIVGLAPFIGGGLSLAVWLLWALGIGLLVLLGAAGSVGLVLWRRSRGAGGRATVPPSRLLGSFTR